MGEYASRAGEKLEHALNSFEVSPKGLACADFGSNAGGFVDCLLKFGASKVYAVETGYGVLDWKLRNDERVVVMERTNAMHVRLPERVQLITIDTSWTKLENIIPNALENLAKDGNIIALVKPHYEAGEWMLQKGKLPDEQIPEVLDAVKERLGRLSVKILGETKSPIEGEKGKNKEYLLFLRKRHN